MKNMSHRKDAEIAEEEFLDLSRGLPGLNQRSTASQIV